MVLQTIVPTERTVAVAIPEEYVNHEVEIIVMPVPHEPHQERRESTINFLARHQTDLSSWKFNRDELYER